MRKSRTAESYVLPSEHPGSSSSSAMYKTMLYDRVKPKIQEANRQGNFRDMGQPCSPPYLALRVSVTGVFALSHLALVSSSFIKGNPCDTVIYRKNIFGHSDSQNIFLIYNWPSCTVPGSQIPKRLEFSELYEQWEHLWS